MKYRIQTILTIISGYICDDNLDYAKDAIESITGHKCYPVSLSRLSEYIRPIVFSVYPEMSKARSMFENGKTYTEVIAHFQSLYGATIELESIPSGKITSLSHTEELLFLDPTAESKVVTFEVNNES
ncbi:MAG: hypothetical protein AAGD25_06495 [Cyanobacteria bacterium P01_F01_bin.150]